MEVKKIPKKIITVIEPKQSMTVDKEKYRQKRVAAYCRVSTDSEEQLTSYENQKKVYTEMIAQKPEWCLAGIYPDVDAPYGQNANAREQHLRLFTGGFFILFSTTQIRNYQSHYQHTPLHHPHSCLELY